VLLEHGELEMASSKDKFKDALNTAKVKQVKASTKVPEGWEEGATWDEGKGEGTLTTASMPLSDTVKDWNPWLRKEGFDPKYFYIDEDTMKYRTWTGISGDKMVHYNVTIKKRRKGYDEKLINEYINEAKRIKRKKPELSIGDNAFVVVYSDWQTGKNEGGGIKNLTKRIEVGLSETLWRYECLVKAGYTFDEIIVLAGGDIVEGCDGFYEMQTFSVELDDTAQIKLAVNLMDACIQELAKLGPKVTVITVPGNHGENRGRRGKSYTTFMDNKDLQIAWILEEKYKANPDAFGNITSIYPQHVDDDIVVTYKVKGQVLGLAHGHQFRSGGGTFVPAKAQSWHMKQSYDKESYVGYADILVYGHFHHFTMIEDPRILIGAPALDGGSKWIEQTHGKRTKAGILTFCIDKNGVHNLYKCEKKKL